jgi:hypothetical protein
MRANRANDQLTDGGPSATPELPNGVAGPPFGGAFGSVCLLHMRRRGRSRAAQKSAEMKQAAKIQIHPGTGG